MTPKCDGSQATTLSMLRELRRAITPPGGIMAVRAMRHKNDDEDGDTDSSQIIDLDPMVDPRDRMALAVHGASGSR